MKKLHGLALLVLLSVCLGAMPAPGAPRNEGGKRTRGAEHDLPSDARELAIGDTAPDFSLSGVDGKTYTLADFKSAEVLMVIFLSNHCPFSHAAEDRLLPWYAKVKTRGVAVVAINPNHPDAVRIDELGYSKYNDSFEE